VARISRGWFSVSRNSNRSVASHESCGRPTPTPNHHPSPLLVPLAPKRGQGERRGGHTMPSAQWAVTLLTPFGRPTAADALHFRSKRVRRNTQDVLGSPQLRRFCFRRRADTHAPDAAVAAVVASRSLSGAVKRPKVKWRLRSDLGVSTVPHGTKVKSICSGGPANLRERCTDALRSLHGVAPSSFPLAPFRGEGGQEEGWGDDWGSGSAVRRTRAKRRSCCFSWNPKTSPPKTNPLKSSDQRRSRSVPRLRGRRAASDRSAREGIAALRGCNHLGAAAPRSRLNGLEG
jgi:hypothetical protein